MPRPKENESKDEYLSRCMSVVSKEEGKEDWSRERKYAHCNGLWEKYRGQSSKEKVVFAIDGEPIEQIAQAVADE